jgi:endonuclease YncB( thermonuclease family)
MRLPIPIERNNTTASAARLLSLLLLIGAWCIVPASAQESTRAVQVNEVLDGASFKSGSDTIRLAGIEVPLPGDGRYAQRWAEQAQRLLQKLLADKTATLMVLGRDRYGRLLAQVDTSDGTWLQGALLKAGLARVWTGPDANDRLADMLKLEQEARDGRRGMWSDPFFVVLPAQDIDRRHLDRLQIVEGRVKAVATIRNVTFLNFGDDWRRDFTIEISNELRRSFVKAGLDPKSLQGKLIRVRGWPFWRNGPAIEVKSPTQIEVLD